MSPARKAMRQPLSSPREFNRPLKMPLIPAIRPVDSISSTAESPINAPPIAADTGVKLAMTEFHGLEGAPNHRRALLDRNPFYSSPFLSRRHTAPSTL